MSKEAATVHCEHCQNVVPLLADTCRNCGTGQDWTLTVPCQECRSDVDVDRLANCPQCDVELSEWDVVVRRVLRVDYHTSVVVSKDVAHPETAGFERSRGLPVRQNADYRRRLPDDSEIHVWEYDDRYEVHRDRYTADSPLRHVVQDVPGVTVAGAGLLVYLLRRRGVSRSVVSFARGVLGPA
jgi:RNA polymerase subunit RPABC4/transcription elongation factor Spt4